MVVSRDLLWTLALVHSTVAVSVPEVWAKNVRRLSRRADSSNVTVPAAISIAPSQYWDGNDGPWSSFPLQLGGGTVQTQNVRVMPSTAGYNTWVINGTGGCPAYYVPDCNNIRGFTYDWSKSVTYQPLTPYGTEIESNLGLDTTGDAGYEDITLGWQGSGGPKVDHSVLFAIADSNYWIGIFGLNPLPTNFSTLNSPQPSFMELLYNSSGIPSRSYGYTAGNQYRFNKVYGSLTLGGYDTSRFKPTDTTFKFGGDISRDLLVDISAISTGDARGNKNLLPDGQISAYLDSTVAEIWLPETACSAFENAFGLEYNSTVNRYLVSGDKHQTLTTNGAYVNFTLTNGSSTVDIGLPYGAFDLNVSFPIVDNGTTSYYFPLQRAANESQYTLGRAFFQEAYIIADYDRGNFTVAPCKWDQTALQNTNIHSILSPDWTSKAKAAAGSSSSSFGAGAIAGVVVGIIALIALIAFLVWFLRRRRTKTRAAKAAELEAKNPSPPSPDSNNNEGRPFISAPIGGELGGGEIHELTAPHKPYAQELDSPHKIDPNKAGYSEMDGGRGEAGYFGSDGKYAVAHEMEGRSAIYEMPGSDVQELGTGREERVGQSNRMSWEPDVKR
ncbi:hypothetical protein LTR95_009779 [Oleoguttula sp. CCFEE 5521]